MHGRGWIKNALLRGVGPDWCLRETPARRRGRESPLGRATETPLGIHPRVARGEAPHASLSAVAFAFAFPFGSAFFPVRRPPPEAAPESSSFGAVWL